MKSIPVDELKPDMILAADACDLSGRLLVGHGSCVTDKQIRLMKMWGVVQVSIFAGEGDEPIASNSVPMSPGEQAQIQTQIEVLFQHANIQFPPVKHLMQLCTERSLNG